MANLEGKYLTFALGDEEYGVGILKVKEIIGMMPVVQIPKAPEYIKGIINLRGMVIPILDLRLRFGMESEDYTEKTCIIVVEAHKVDSMQKCWEVNGCGKNDCPGYESSDLRCWMISGTFCRDEIQGSYHEKKEACQKCSVYETAQEQNALFVQGIVVDAVSEVLPIKSDDIEDTPTLGTRVDTGYILGMAKADDKVKILLNIDKILNAEEMTLAKAV